MIFLEFSRLLRKHKGLALGLALPILLALNWSGCAIETERAEWNDDSRAAQESKSQGSGSQLSEGESQEAALIAENLKKEREEKQKLITFCQEILKAAPGETDEQLLATACNQVRLSKVCRSVEGRPIFHYQRLGEEKGRRVLVFAGIHGDEQPSASVAREWMNRLTQIDPRNTWRILPVVNPDGTRVKTRTNARKVDINRNFPSIGWEDTALDYWKKRVGSNPRKYPGPSPASEPETRCAVQHIQSFEPELIISVHTPLGVLDFDGPRVDFPKAHLPWIRLGHFPGSLGRYMWRDHKVPVLTVELKGNAVKGLEKLDQLQDLTGTLAIRALRALGRE